MFPLLVLVVLAAIDVQLGQRADLFIAPVGDVEIVRFHAIQGEQVKLTCIPADSLALKAQVLDETLTPVVPLTEGLSGEKLVLSFVAPATGAYSARLEGSGAATGGHGACSVKTKSTLPSGWTLKQTFDTADSVERAGRPGLIAKLTLTHQESHKKPLPAALVGPSGPIDLTAFEKSAGKDKRKYAIPFPEDGTFSLQIETNTAKGPLSVKLTVVEKAAPAVVAENYVLPALHAGLLWHASEDPDVAKPSPPSCQEVKQRLASIAPRAGRFFIPGLSNNLDCAVIEAKAQGAFVAAVVWIGANTAANDAELTRGIDLALQGRIDVLLIGNEVLLREEVSSAYLISMIQQAQVALPDSTALVGTADTWHELLTHPDVVAACDTCGVNIYPIHEFIPIADAPTYLVCRYMMVDAAYAIPVFISETGWPTQGAPQGAAKPSVKNARKYLREVLGWAELANVDCYPFASHDEAWKDGIQAHFGLFKQNGAPKANAAGLVRGDLGSGLIEPDTLPGGAGAPAITLDSYPPLGAKGPLAGAIQHTNPYAAEITLYIHVGAAGWWIKPTAAQPFIWPECGGTWSEAQWWSAPSDLVADQICAFLFPIGYQPPTALGLPAIPAAAYADAIAWTCVTR